MKEASDKLIQYENQFLAAEAKEKQHLIEKEETSKKLASLLQAEAEKMKLLVEKDNSAKEASTKLAQVENQLLTAQK
jgi:hypothetical protein